jgi:hypothetical protein
MYGAAPCSLIYSCMDLFHDGAAACSLIYACMELFHVWSCFMFGADACCSYKLAYKHAQ